jgi:putative hydrolase of the HAD superfamily
MPPPHIYKRLAESRGILFDLDNTLYPKEKGVFDMIKERINDFVATRTGLGPEEVLSLRRCYIARYGTTLGGLMKHDNVDPDRFLEFVHDVPVEEMLEPDPELVSFLLSIELPKVIFTNASFRHAERVLGILGIKHFFEDICDLAKTGYLGKPHRRAFIAAARMLSQPLGETVFLDDVPEYVEAGARFGALTVHVGADEAGPGHFRAVRIVDLGKEFTNAPWFNTAVQNPGSRAQSWCLKVE